MRHLLLIALLLLTAAAATTQPTTSPADQSEFTRRLAELKPDNLQARLDLARWARQHELYPQATSLARDILKQHPAEEDARAAWTVLQQVDQLVPMPAEPDTDATLKDEFNRRFKREPSTPAAFKTRNSRHFVMCYDTTDTFAASRGASLEKAYDAFLFFFTMQKLRPAFLEKRLVVILFKDRGDYLAYAKSSEGADVSWAAGYYSQRTNRSAFYDDSTSPEAESVEKQTDRLRGILKSLGTEIEQANAKNDHTLARRLSDQRTHIADILAQINIKVDNALGVMNAVKTVHEAAHQLAFNTGIQKRLVDYPLWFAEGLACSFEIEDRNGRRGPSIVNYGRLAVLKEALKRDKLIPVEDFITNPQPTKMDENTMSIFYAEGWALFHYLYKNNRAGMEKYLLAYNKQTPFKIINPETRRKLFTEAFGDDFPTLEKNLTRYLKDLPNKAP